MSKTWKQKCRRKKLEQIDRLGQAKVGPPRREEARQWWPGRLARDPTTLNLSKCCYNTNTSDKLARGQFISISIWALVREKSICYIRFAQNLVCPWKYNLGHSENFSLTQIWILRTAAWLEINLVDEFPKSRFRLCSEKDDENPHSPQTRSKTQSHTCVTSNPLHVAIPCKRTLFTTNRFLLH